MTTDPITAVNPHSMFTSCSLIASSKLVTKILIRLAIVLAASNSLFAQELYHLDFQTPELGGYTPIFGNPTVQSSVGPLNDALLFHAVATYDQISLPIGTAAPVYNVDFDLLTHGLVSSEYAYTILLDTPEVRTIDFHGGLNAIDMINLGTVRPFSDDQVYHCEITADFPRNRLSFTVDHGQTFTAAINASHLESIRFSMAPWKFGAPDAPGTYVALDNVTVTAIPEPASISLFLTGFLLLGGLFRTSARLCVFALRSKSH